MDTKPTPIDATIVGKVLRHSRHMILQDDRDTGAYLVTCETGWCFEQPDAKGQNGLHEMVTDYSCGLKREALPLARDDFNSHEAEPCEAFARGNCEWCNDHIIPGEE